MMQANVANFVRQEVKVSKRKPLLPIFEAVSNSLDAITDRKQPGTIRVTVLRQPELFNPSRGPSHTFIVEDNGIGFNDENMAAFDELYSDRKVRQGGKGRGRFAFLKVFEKVEITSIFETDRGKKARTFTFDTNYAGYTEVPTSSTDNIGTKVTLSGMRTEYADKVPKASLSLAREFISHFLPILLSDRQVEIIINDEDQIRLTELVRGELLIDKTQTDFAVGSRKFSLLSVKLRPKQISLRHRLILAASAREVSGHNLEKFIPVLTPGPLELEGEPDGFFFVSIVEGEYLDQAVDPMRVTFTDEDDDQTDEDEAEVSDEPLVRSPDLFGEPQSIGEIRREALKIIQEQLNAYITAAIAHRSEAIENYIRRDGMGYHFIKREIPELAKNLKSTDDRTIEASLHAAAYVERRRRNAQANQLLSASPKEKSEDSYFNRWTYIVESLGDVAKSDLANYVAH